MTDGIRPEFLTVRELAELLRIKERKVYDLAASGAVPCSRATGKLLFPEAEVRAWLERRRSGPEAAAARPGVFLGSHDPLLEWALRQSRCGLAMFFDGSMDGLRRFAAREGVAAGLHVHDAASGAWNVPLVARDCAGMDAVLLGWAGRRRGLVVRPASGGKIASPADLRGRVVAARQRDSGTDLLLRQVLAAEGIGEAEVRFTEPAHSEGDAVLAVLQGAADAAFGLESLARQHGLRFIPVTEERFDLLIDRRAYFEPPLWALLRFCRGEAFRERAEAMGGYDLDGHGQVRWNG